MKNCCALKQSHGFQEQSTVRKHFQCCRCRRYRWLLSNRSGFLNPLRLSHAAEFVFKHFLTFFIASEKYKCINTTVRKTYEGCYVQQKCSPCCIGDEFRVNQNQHRYKACLENDQRPYKLIGYRGHLIDCSSWCCLILDLTPSVTNYSAKHELEVKHCEYTQ